MSEQDALVPSSEEEELSPGFPAGAPQFSSSGTRFTNQAQRELLKLTADFSTRLHTRALEKAQNTDDVQSSQVLEAHGEIVASPIDTVADIGITIILPFGFLLLGLVGNDLLALVNDQKAIPAPSVVISFIGGICVGASVAVNSKRYALKRYIRRRRSRP